MHIAKKKFGQNFITDGNLIEKIISYLPNEKDQLVIEIGPGKGALTKKLVNQFSKVIAIEIDKDLETILKTSIKNDNFELIIEDFLNVDLENIIKKHNFKKVSIISNTPYYIISSIIFKCFSLQKHITKAVFMVQKEVGERICANINSKNYNNLSVISNYYATPKYLFTINRKLFKPIPEVDSALIEFDFTKNKLGIIKDNEKFTDFVRTLFNNKRKTILNNLSMYTKNKVIASNYILNLKLDPNLRPENLTTDDFISLYKEVNNEN
ncbi:dimethyladenosine transferase [Spiroplasma litorale]|uniref:Ribosomal RNA small subunit methyltransferase A n=1 Tax=Spiroplasma litorale TaxID=216942 RepID=A0A0K1W310_9MOLU|nr:16S rRNA (adenine(1518)-N(6)/adenine(1519)-N(6))-dimethyltransferase RsmA [Spiroplasma litorale]AKX34710.1 dimethyladenosine transferase [Spiroplasma litorale]